MKMPLLFKRPQKKLQATARRIPQPAIDDYEAEPNVRLSTAFVVVLILHIVAIGGVYAFSSVKARKMPLHDNMESISAAASQKETAVKPEAHEATATSAASAKTYRVKAGDTLGKIATLCGVTATALEEANGLKNGGALRTGQELKIPDKSQPTTAIKPAEAKKPSDPAAKTAKDGAAPPKDSGTYLVAKGDNPVNIAKRFGVNYDELLKLNKIEDPRKLQIGQKLILPKKAKVN